MMKAPGALLSTPVKPQAGVMMQLQQATRSNPTSVCRST